MSDVSSSYEYLSTVATGGMAQVLLARMRRLGGFEKLVVIKRILPDLAVDPKAAQMLLDEARIAATLDHHNIVQVYDVGLDDGAVFIAMEHLDGKDVRMVLAAERARDRRMPLAAATAIALGACAGLEYAHERKDPQGEPLGIVHRDVSPHNVFVTYEGGVKIIDFGVAKARNRLGSTDQGILKGKLAYMSPEQARCEPLDRRSDVFGMGVMLYEMTTGKRPFVAENEYEMLQQILYHVPAPPSARVEAYPPTLERIVLRALEKVANARYPTMREMQRDLDAFAREEGSLSQLELAEYMQDLFRDELERTRADPNAELGPVSARRGRLSLPSASTARVSNRPARSVSPPPREIATVEVDATARPTRSRLPLLVGAAGVVAVVGSIGGVAFAPRVLFRSSNAADSANTVGSVASAAPDATLPTEGRLSDSAASAAAATEPTATLVAAPSAPEETASASTRSTAAAPGRPAHPPKIAPAPERVTKPTKRSADPDDLLPHSE